MSEKVKIGKILDKFVENKKEEGVVYYSIDSFEKFIAYYMKFNRRDMAKIRLFKKKESDESKFSEYMKEQRVLAIKSNCDWYGDKDSDKDWIKKEDALAWLDRDKVTGKQILKEARKVKE